MRATDADGTTRSSLMFQTPVHMSCDPVAVLAFFKKKRQVGYKKYEEEYIVGCTTTRGRFQGLKCGRLTLDPSTKELNLIANVEYAHQQ